MKHDYDDWSADEMQEQLRFYEKLLEALIGPKWKSMTISDLNSVRKKRDGQQVVAIGDLSKMCANEFGGRCKANLTIFSDGTCEVYLDHVESCSDDGYDHQQTKVKVALGSRTYPITPSGLQQMLDDLTHCDWMTGQSQTPQGARAEVADLKRVPLILAEEMHKQKPNITAVFDRYAWELAEKINEENL